MCLRLGRCLHRCLALRQLDGEPERFGILAPEPPRIRLRRHQGAAEDRREECVLGIHRCAHLPGASIMPPPFPRPLPLAAGGLSLRLRCPYLRRSRQGHEHLVVVVDALRRWQRRGGGVAYLQSPALVVGQRGPARRNVSFRCCHPI